MKANSSFIQIVANAEFYHIVILNFYWVGVNTKFAVVML